MTRSASEAAQVLARLPHHKALALALIGAACLIGPLAVARAMGPGSVEAQKPLKVAIATAPDQGPKLIAATGYGLGEPGPTGYVEPTPEEAFRINQARPISSLPNPAARPFPAAFSDDFDRGRAVDCLTAAVYYEAALESEDGQKAVAQVVLNRVRHPAFAKTVCAVVFEGSTRTTGCQFTFTCDGSLGRKPDAKLWERSRKVAAAALAGAVYKPVGYATHYHTVWVSPYWSPSLVKVANVGLHIFYRWEGGWGTPGAFNARYAATETETDIQRLAAVAPIALFQKAAFVRAPIEPPPHEPEAEAAAIPAVALQAKPIEVAAIAPTMVLPTAPAAAPEVKTVELPTMQLSRRAVAPSSSRLAAPPGW